MSMSDKRKFNIVRIVIASDSRVGGRSAAISSSTSKYRSLFRARYFLRKHTDKIRDCFAPDSMGARNDGRGISSLAMTL
jgi:hypothetical protein